MLLVLIVVTAVLMLLKQILTTFELSSIFGGSWGSIGKFSLPKSVKRSV